MAISKSGAFGQVSGKLGGIEFAQNGLRTVVKQGKVRRGSTTPSQLRAQGLQAEVIAHWRALTDTQRLAWERAAKERLVRDRFGDKVTRNGFQLYASIPHDFRFCVNEYWTTVPPARTETQQFSFISVASRAPELVVSTPSFYSPTFSFLGGYVSRMCPNETRAPKSWKSFGMVVFITSPTIFTTELVDCGLSFLEGELIACQYFMWSLDFWPVWSEVQFLTVGGV